MRGEHDSVGRDPEDEDHQMPRWVKVSGAIALLVVAILLVVHLAGGGLGGHAP